MPGPLDWWPLTGADALHERLEVAWSSPSRGYHDRQHLTEVLTHLDKLVTDHPVARLDVLRLAAWFHDAVYDVGGDLEERSARLAEEELSAAGVPPDDVAEVARLVRLTAGHRPAEDDLHGRLLCDADLAILAAGPERYGEYVAGVRKEYAHVSDADFRAGRRAVLEDLLTKPHLFETDAGRELWEQDARANLAAEITRLTPG